MDYPSEGCLLLTDEAIHRVKYDPHNEKVSPRHTAAEERCGRWKRPGNSIVVSTECPGYSYGLPAVGSMDYPSEGCLLLTDEAIHRVKYDPHNEKVSPRHTAAEERCGRWKRPGNSIVVSTECLL